MDAEKGREAKWKKKKKTCVSIFACSTPVYEYGVGGTRVVALGSGSLFIAAVSDLLIGNFCFLVS